MSDIGGNWLLESESVEAFLGVTDGRYRELPNEPVILESMNRLQYKCLFT